MNSDKNETQNLTIMLDSSPCGLSYGRQNFMEAGNRLSMTNTKSRIIYTHTDEAPALATYSFLPIIQTFAKACDVAVETRDISLAGRIVAVFPERLTKAQQIPDAL